MEVKKLSNFDFDKVLEKYDNNPANILSKYSYESGDDIFEKINESSSDLEELKGIINCIVLWKLNRLVYIEDDVLLSLKNIQKIKSPKEVIDYHKEEVKRLLIDLLESKGVRLAMASTFLHFFNPEVFPIIDQRAYRVIFLEDYKPSFNVEKNAEVYMEYLEKCIKYYDEKLIGSLVQFCDIDKYLYQLDILASNRVKM